MPVLERFNSAAQFVVRKPMTLSGIRMVLGDPFPKEAVAERRLRQLYAGRWIAQLSADKTPRGETKKEKKRGI
jgi:hypothetical protein